MSRQNIPNDKRRLMVSLNYVDKLKWSQDEGRRLSQLRDKIPMRALADKISASGVSCSYQYIHKLEEGKAESVSTDLILAICGALDIDFNELFPGIYLDISQIITKD